MILKGDYTPKERIMVATTGNPRLIDFALKECKNRLAELDILFIRHLAVTPMGPTAPPSLAGGHRGPRTLRPPPNPGA